MEKIRNLIDRVGRPVVVILMIWGGCLALGTTLALAPSLTHAGPPAAPAEICTAPHLSTH